MEESTTNRELLSDQNTFGNCCGINRHLPTKALFSKRPPTPEAIYSSSSHGGDSAHSSRASLFSPVFSHPERSSEPDVASLDSAAVHAPLSPCTQYTVNYFTTDMPASRKPMLWSHTAETFCTCADESGVQAPAAVEGGGGGNTLVSIPIPVSVPLPLGQSGGGGQGGPIIITSPPPPAPPNPPMPPHPPAQRAGVAQDVASMLMMLLMNHVRERIDGTSADIRNQQMARDHDVAAAAATAAVEAVSKAQNKEPMVPAWMFRELLPGARKRGSIDSDRRKKKLANKKKGWADLLPLDALAPQPQPPPLVLPFSMQDTELLPATHITKIPDESPKESPGDGKESKEGSPDEEETPSGTFRVAVPFCDRCCCYSIVIILLASVLAINLAFLIAPEGVTNFLCEMGIEERKNASKNARLFDMDGGNDTEVETLGQGSGLRRIGARREKSIFDIEEPEHEDEPPPMPHGDVFETAEQPSVVHAATETSLPRVVEARFAARERCSAASVATTAQDFRHGDRRYGLGETSATKASTRTKRRVLRDRLGAMMVAAVNTGRALKLVRSGAVNHSPAAHNLAAAALTHKRASPAAPSGVQRKAGILRRNPSTSDWVRILVVPAPKFRNYSLF
ncbi:uncharacterized protein [Dermacentor albipictus]|uniref:uncharacterized protein isoform X2 n=1 Tax=Dermacentor albipictus TaxID=60249 RepID=UPI0038FD095B